MANEKLAILKMLEEGKISAEEAARLMSVTENKDTNQTGNQYGSPASENKTTYTQNTGYNQGYNQGQNQGFNQGQNQGANQGQNQGYNQGQNQGFNQSQNQGFNQGQNQYQQQNPNYNKNFETFATDVGRKIDVFARDMEPKIQKFAKTVVEKTADIADSLSKTINESTVNRGSTYNPHYGKTYNPSQPYTGSTYKPQNKANATEKNFEIKVQPGYCELNLSSLNGDCMINGYNGDKISAKVYYKAKVMNPNIELMKLGDKYYLNYDDEEFEFVTIDAYVPDSMFKNIKLEAVNGNAFASTISGDYLTLNTINGSIDLKNVHVANIHTDSGNGNLNIFNISGEKAEMELFNGNIMATGIDVSDLRMSTNNGTMTVNVDYLRHFNEYNWKLDASNGKFTMNVPSLPELGYDIKAKTALSNVKIGLSNMEYLINSGSVCECRSLGFANAPKKVFVKAETSNAPIIVN